MTAKRLSVKKREVGHRAPDTQKLTNLVTEDDKVRLNVEMAKAKRQALKARAVMEGTTIHQLVNRLIDEYLSEKQDE
ncbi:plasmid partition protein ParG [Halochromatium salexigens]|uniref:ParG protein n=1 Tax=Halochromatium salexigens TaxID=49447 RepID=A0AAJ0UES2_HALSE|nr:plasmid partition protein ParG [Halochromatium salexigens]MBK5930115.1 hypothetical protein [Halochromatium salexigens]